MKLTLSTILAFTALSTAAPAEVEKRAACNNPVLRKNWHSATQAEKTSYINAVKCLATKPSKLGGPATLYDDFTIVHRDLDLRIHGVASFLPWHRYFIQVYEDHLKQCGYTGALMYWDWEVSAETYSDVGFDPIWSASNFGGNGRIDSSNTTNRCLLDGPFTQLRPVYWDLTPYIAGGKCITRQFQNLTIPGWQNPDRPLYANRFNKAVMDSVRQNNQFATFQGALQNGPHAMVHTGIGGEMRRPVVSTNDPIFFLHHTQVDRVWWLWQQQNLTARAYDFSGVEQGGVVASLDYTLTMRGLAPNMTVRDYMVSNNNYQCFKY